MPPVPLLPPAPPPTGVNVTRYPSVLLVPATEMVT
jgi:hypothetical protein